MISPKRLAVLLCLVPLVGCPDPAPATQVLVVFEADRAVRQVARDIEIVAYGGSRGDSFPRENMQSLRFNIEDIGGWPVSHTLIPLRGDVTRLYQVEGRLYDQDEQPIAHVRAISGFLDERSLVLRLRFYANCLYLEPCATDDYSCNADGNCEIARVNPEGLPDLPGGDAGVLPDGGTEPTCRTAIDCDDGVPCTVDGCVDGVCLSREEHTLCTELPDGRCDAALGCQYAPAGGCNATNCRPGPCEASATCNAEGNCEHVFDCAAPRVCCGGTCMLCNDGDLCTDMACDDASGACVATPATADCDNGEFCDGVDTCVGGACVSPGDPCEGMSTCDPATDACVGCASAADCPATALSPSTPTCVASGPFCAPMGTATQMRIAYTCTAGSCVSSSTIVSMSCTVPSREGMSCGAGTLVPTGPCEAVSGAGRCDPMGEQEFRTQVLQCVGTACQDIGGGGTSTQPCTLMVPSDCFTMDAGMDSSADTGSDDTGSGMPDSSDPDTGSTDTGSGIPDSSVPDTGSSDTGSGVPDSSSSPDTLPSFDSA